MHRCLFLLCLSSSICFSQSEIEGPDDASAHSVYYGNRLSTHPFGVLRSRINQKYQIASSDRISLAIHISNGNVWLPNVLAYNPLNEDDRIELGKYLWNDREFHFDEGSMPASSMELHADGVIRFYHMHLKIPLAAKHELDITTRAFSLDQGRVPYSLLTSDQFIEWFHSNVFGGEDPFARVAYGLNKAGIRYQDANDQIWELNKGSFTMSGFDVTYNFYPDIKGLRRKDIYVNFGLQLGFNVSQANPSMDMGLSSSLLKILAFKNGTELRFGLGLHATRLKIISFGGGLELSNRSLLMGSEFLINYLIPTRRKGHFSIAGTYYIQSSYFKRSDFKHIVLRGERISSHWHYGISHLYKPRSATYLIFSYSQGILDYSLFLREDFSVDNAPDVQVGLGIRVSF